MNKPTVRTVGICVGHSLPTRPMNFYSVAEVDAYIAHLEAKLASAEGKLAAAHIVRDSWKARAWTAEEKLVELKKQPPVGEAVNIGGAIMVEWERCVSDGTQLFTRPAPAINIAELVLDENDNPQGFTSWYERHFATQPYKGASHVTDCENAWRAAILRNIEKVK